MRYVMILTMGLSWLSVPAAAQTTGAGFGEALSPSLAAVANVMHSTIRRNLIEAAEAMPAADYAFKPTPDIRSFAQLIGHVVNANFFFCAQGKAEPSPATTNYERETDKAALVKALSASLTLCDGVYTATTDTSFQQPVKLTGPNAGETVRGAVLTFNTAHNNEHYGNIVLYLRLKGIVPPSTARTQKPK